MTEQNDMCIICVYSGGMHNITLIFLGYIVIINCHHKLTVVVRL